MTRILDSRSRRSRNRVSQVFRSRFHCLLVDFTLVCAYSRRLSGHSCRERGAWRHAFHGIVTRLTADYPKMNVETAAHETASAGASFRPNPGWWLFCLLVFAIKFLLLLLDPSPKLFMGDSGSYLWTALTGWIPHDRSYFYGYTIRLLALLPGSFTPLLLVQAVAGG